MELRHIRYFAEVARLGTYQTAADRLHVAQPAVWQQVQTLQQEIGLRLFEKAGRRVRLTVAGRELLEDAERVLAAAERFRSAAADLASGRSGVVAIACYTPHLERFLAPIIGRFERAHPEVRLQVLEFAATGGDVSAIPASAASLLSGEVDLAVGPRPVSGADGFLVDQSRIVALVAQGHPMAAMDRVPLRALEGEPLLLQASRDSFSRSAIVRACHLAGFEPSLKLESRSSAALAALAEHGVGVALLPDAVVPRDFSGVVRQITEDGDLLGRETWLCWREGSLSAPALRAFVDVAIDWMRAVPPAGSSRTDGEGGP